MINIDRSGLTKYRPTFNGKPVELYQVLKSGWGDSYEFRGMDRHKLLMREVGTEDICVYYYHVFPGVDLEEVK